MRKRVVLCLCCVPVAVAAVVYWCWPDPVAALDAAEQFTLYSVDGREFAPGKEPKAEEKFHGHPVLGKVEVVDPDRRKEIVAALREGLASWDATPSKCFVPRHAIRAVARGRTVDYVICFECSQLEVHDGGSRSVKTVGREPQEVFNRHLREAGVPLAPPGHVGGYEE
jgi:hypothetical protein